ncbi:glycosyltransferase family 25 protein [Aestuariibacter sp. GS-14]|uniref:glycosyltransferase family 25 protein n=1 Tax=Aestuariibacter sp. GS-14 TaxID=2590670 RepID=UPI00112DD247|nr:glycosyltransferase family 25 protein [Aestuariibacter sp. GS-14]TPV62108.1 glycosyltransferase family 25 protein [Aestuariibacter sp. GS-14]
MSVKVISLNRQFSNPLGIQYSFFDGIDNKNRKSEFKFNLEKFEAKYGRYPTNGEIGCALSHFEIIKSTSKNSRNVIIMEDDAIVSPMFKEKYLEFINHEFERPVILIFGYVKLSPKNVWLYKLKWPKFNKIKLSGLKFGNSNHSGCGAVAYLVSDKACQLISNQYEIWWQADDWRVYHKMGIDVLFIENPIIFEDIYSPTTTGSAAIEIDSFWSYPVDNLQGIISGFLKRFRLKKGQF